MKFDVINNIFRIALPALLLLSGSCTKEKTSGLELDADVSVLSFALDEYQGEVDLQASAISVPVPADCDPSAMTVTELEIPEGAEATLKEGDVLDMSLPRTLRVSAGDVYMDYSIDLRYDEAKILSFTAEGCTGIIDEASHRIVVNVPAGTDLTSIVPFITVNDGASVTPASGSAQDFSQPVKYTVTCKTAVSVYTVEVKAVDAPEIVFIGLADTFEQLNPEEKEAAGWLLSNFANAAYVSFSDAAAGMADLSQCKAVWWHLHIDGGIDSRDKFENAAPEAVSAEAVAQMRSLLNSGTGFVLTRFATYYASDLGVTKDGKIPNNCWGQVEESGEITSGPWSFFVQGHEAHALYEGIQTFQDGEKTGVYTCDTGYRITNSTCQWHIGSDWGGYATLDDWRTNHGGIDLGYGGDGAVVAWEYASDGTRGKVLCIGSGCYDWYSHGVDESADKYHGNVALLTGNAINYVAAD